MRVGGARRVVLLQPGLAARTRPEDWQVNLVDELTSKALAREGTLRQDTVETKALHQVLM